MNDIGLIPAFQPALVADHVPQAAPAQHLGQERVEPPPARRLLARLAPVQLLVGTHERVSVGRGPESRIRRALSRRRR